MQQNDNRKIQLTLPWPPTANTYWRRNGNCYFISPKGISYRNQVKLSCPSYRNAFQEKDRLSLSILSFPPDRRRRDIDNILKCLLDSLQHASVYVDDNQIDVINITRMPTLAGIVDVTISTI